MILWLNRRKYQKYIFKVKKKYAESFRKIDIAKKNKRSIQRNFTNCSKLQLKNKKKFKFNLGKRLKKIAYVRCTTLMEKIDYK